MQDFSWQSIAEQMAKERVELLKRTNKNKDILFDILKKNKVEHILVCFDGSGDSGDIQSIELTPESTQPLLEETALGFIWPECAIDVEVSIKDAIETICYDFLRAKHQGWENNEGAYGTFEFHVNENKIHLDFNERTVSEYSDEF